jgi:hypothetical protein
MHFRRCKKIGHERTCSNTVELRQVTPGGVRFFGEATTTRSYTPSPILCLLPPGGGVRFLARLPENTKDLPSRGAPGGYLAQLYCTGVKRFDYWYASRHMVCSEYVMYALKML